MIVARLAFSNESKQPERALHLDAHKRHIRQASIIILQSGPFFDDEREITGGMIIAEVDSMASMRTFNDSDPFVIHGIYRSVYLVNWQITAGVKHLVENRQIHS